MTTANAQISVSTEQNRADLVDTRGGYFTSKVAEGTRLTWVCRIVNHCFRWKGHVPWVQTRAFYGTCLICGAKRRDDLYWPAPPPRKGAA